ncbi:MAG TPA: hypothetical protein PLP61_02000 [Nocardioides sp.]|uniref:hypothetical protein n=1 Tax=Nocardioides sp. TaxID=35761 RepID=UPI002B624276|nr:hypothetical protein [Nocardioides sp.]HQR25786.1 hypothetical protein [Nocardioides sp.]
MSSPAVQVRSRVPRLADLSVARARLSVVPRTTGPASTMPFVLLVTVLLVGGVVSLLMFNTSMQQASFTATDLEQQAATLSAREQSLQMDLERLRNPQRVAEQAHRMGMVLPAASGFLRLSDGSLLEPGPVTNPVPALRLRPLPPPKPEILLPERVVVQAGHQRAGGDTSTASPAAGPRDGRTGSTQRHDRG